ncbi:52 kDa repressor of the inhibitor of the protein kinase [Stylophora pistillata]|uniref:52 kDa repressor of the inhibitor of the protein kinase n=1 Tax=Stylophora pistillata TaxID=50429 RepID=A0A2B4R4N2_STYPI|nr:52 kDa repressor of the inhibitor of the protein kinase [Stylophora pistillata]
MATTRPITTFFQPVKSIEIENETVNGEEAQAEPMEFENVELCDNDAEVLLEGPVSSGVIQGGSRFSSTNQHIVSYFDVGDILSGKVGPRTLQSHEKINYLKTHINPLPSYAASFSKTVVKGKDKHIKKLVFQPSWLEKYTGHRDDSTSTASNKGNFHAILMLLGNSNKNLQEHLLTGGRNATSTSKTLQESVLYFVNLDKTTDESIANAILSSLAENNIEVTFARGQGYDGASPMSSEGCGVQGRIRRIPPMALYTHCNSHVLNLSVAAVWRRQRFLDQLLEKCGSTSRKEKLKGLRKTRWVERHECYETFYEIYEYVCISLEAIVDHESHPHVYSSLSFTWDRETKTKTQGPLANLRTLGFIFTFFNTTNSPGTLKPIAAKLQKKDQDVFQAYSMIDDSIKAVFRVRSNIEKECHEWFEDASRLADKIGATFSVPRITGRQEHRNNAPSVNPQSHYRVNVAIPFIDHLLEEMSSRFREDNRAGAEIFSLASSAEVKHDSLLNLAEKLQFWQQGLPTPSSLLSEVKEWQYFWKQYTPTLQLPVNLIECVKYADEDMYPNIRVLLIIGCTFPVSSA